MPHSQVTAIVRFFNGRVQDLLHPPAPRSLSKEPCQLHYKTNKPQTSFGKLDNIGCISSQCIVLQKEEHTSPQRIK